VTARAGNTAGTTYSASFVLPPHAIPSRLPINQVPVGDNLLNHLDTVCYDPFALYNMTPRRLSNYNVAFVGDVGHGKSASMKTFLERMLILPERLPDGTTRKRRAVILDRKGEYRLLAELFGCTPAVLGHGQRINPFDPRLTPQQHLAILENFLRLLFGRELDPLERKVAQVAYDIAAPTELADLHAALAHLPETVAADTLRTRAEVDRAAGDVMLALERLTAGSLRGMFDGPTTTALDWQGQVADVVIHPDYLVGSHRHLVYQLLVAVVSIWLDQSWQETHAERRVDFLVVDEAWDVVAARQGAEMMQDATKLGRSRVLCVLVAFHGPSDF
jgi:hypothetical protein